MKHLYPATLMYLTEQFETDPSIARLFRRWSAAAAVLCVFIAAIVLSGWLFDLAALKGVLPGMAQMKVNTAFGFLLSGAALWLMRKDANGSWASTTGLLLAAVVTLLGLLTLLEHIVGWDLHIDNGLIPESSQTSDTLYPGRMSQATAFNFFFFGIALTLLSVKSRRAAAITQLLVLVPLTVTTTALVGSVYNLYGLYAVKPFASMAPLTVAPSLIVALGILGARPQSGWVGLLSSAAVGGAFARRLLPMVVALLPLLGWAIAAGERAGHFGPEFHVNLLVIGSMLTMSVLIWWSARHINRRDAERQRSERALADKRNAALEEQRRARLAALKLMEDAIAARERAEAAHAALRESETKYRLLADKSTDCIFWTGPDGRFKYISPACHALSGHRVSDFLADPALMVALIHPDDRAHFVAHTADDRAAEPGELDFRLVHKDGSVRWISHHCEPIYGTNGEYLGRHGSNRDITKRKQAEEMGRKLALAVQQSSNSIIITDTQGRIEYVNDAFVQMSGYTVDEVAGKNPRLLQSGETPPSTYADLWASVTQGKPWRGEFANRRKDGTDYLVTATVTPLRQADGQITHHVGVQEDITQSKALNEELEQHRHHLQELVDERTAQLADATQRAEAANTAKSAFLTNMSHEIRTPMNAIIGLTHLLRRHSATPAQLERLTRIDSAAQHLLSIINDILDLSKIEAGKLEIEAHDFSLVDTLDRIRSLIADSALTKGLAVEVDTGDVPTWLRGDATRLRQALLSYAANAVKFTEHGHITLRARRLRDEGDHLLVRFEVEDTGIGIDPQRLPQLFMAFEQADGSTTRRFGGAGLGLAITRRLAHLMGGEAGAESKPGNGSLFWFTAALQHGHSNAPHLQHPIDSADAQLRRGYGGAHLLLVEDDAINREVALTLLNDAGLTTDTAENGRIAVEKIRHTHYDLVLMDIQMPVMDGLAATRAIRAMPDCQDTPILAMSANKSAEDHLAGEQAGINDFVSKPVDPEQLYATLLQWLPSPAGGEAASGVVATPVPGRSTDARLTRLARIPEFDLARGLATLRGDEDKYLRLLQRFVAGHGGDAAKMKESLLDEDLAMVSSQAHGLKGVSATLGANGVAKAAARLEQAMRGVDAVPTLSGITVLIDAIDRALAPLSAVFAEDPETAVTVDSRTFDPAMTHATLDQMAVLLERNDTRILEMLRTNESLLHTALGPRFDKFSAQLEQFDFDTAAALLREVKNTLPA
ncbi:MAG TPA: PAS domain S-box protein [Gammaproteobacteria bacterium]|nr:PAS domain S-box protein [Gammaproteobacteria bacterium]